MHHWSRLPLLPTHVKIVEVGPRDGLQAERGEVATTVKIELIDRLSKAGFRNIEVTSFVSPKWVPQMADGAEVMAGITRAPGVLYSALTPNMRGFEAAVDSKIDEVVVFGSASEAFSRKNLNCSIQESLQRFRLISKAAKELNIRLRGSISCCFGCPYQGAVPTGSVADAVRRLADLGCDEIDLADTIGVGTARMVAEVIEQAATAFPLERLSGHFHDTYGQGLANIFAALQVGMSIFHSSVAGLGGCPYAKGASGNVPTEDVVYLLDGLGIQTGIKLDTVASAGDFISSALGKPNGSRAGRALLARVDGSR
ncbi:hydroxymethylglutaryl-CoA lyase [Paraburkholderia dipogonis]|uniref:hydroxymethylglutaryl-CoA lyase n=1 Tax=Paraburkholderia dipogonis TaxID=1211383 RepID=A0A4Y8MKL2_9BURK|nr:hydroxymethylglutaryl-CoA lyase [Paraburkholderia dipogonis]TFE37961.1 hydroxymethylglutaryl-CoA lyase [Paraburkholderia dipogonis]